MTSQTEGSSSDLSSQWRPGVTQAALARRLGMSQQRVSALVAKQGGARPSQSSYARWVPWPVSRAHRNHYLYRWLLAYARSKAIEAGQVTNPLSEVDEKRLTAVCQVMDEDNVILAGYDAAADDPFWFEPRREGEAGRYVRRPDGVAV